MKLAYNGKYVYVTFKSTRQGLMTYYAYEDVPVDVFYSVVNAESVGSSFHKLIKSQGYTCTKTSRQRDKKTGQFVRAA